MAAKFAFLAKTKRVAETVAFLTLCKDEGVPLAKPIEDLAVALQDQEAAVLRRKEDLENGLAKFPGALEQLLAPAAAAEGEDAPKPVYDDQFVQLLPDYARFLYDTGDYARACAILHKHAELVPAERDSTNLLCGRLACAILAGETATVIDDLAELFRLIDRLTKAGSLPERDLLQLRLSGLHRALFLFPLFASVRGKDLPRDPLTVVADTFSSNLSYIEIAAPHLLRYLTVAVVTGERRRQVLPRVQNSIIQERYRFEDPITSFVDKVLSAEYHCADAELAKAEALLENDFFLCNVKKEFLASARALNFMNFSSVHNRVDISKIDTNAAGDSEATEAWLVDMLRTSHSDAKIDSKNQYLLMGGNPPEIPQQVLDLTKPLPTRIYTLRGFMAEFDNTGRVDGMSNSGTSMGFNRKRAGLKKTAGK